MRVNVKGISGSGKSTFSQQLAERLGVPYLEIDAIHHGPNWTEASAEELQTRVRDFMAGAPDGWVIDGNYESKLGDLVLATADRIVWLDPPLRVALPTAFSGPLKLKQRLGTLDPGKIAATDPAKVEAAFREKPAIHRFPGNMARRVQELAAIVTGEYGGDAARLWTDASDGAELKRRLSELPGFGEMTIKSLSAVLAKQFGVEAARELAPTHPTLGDVDSAEALEAYQAKKRAHKAKLKAERQ